MIDRVKLNKRMLTSDQTNALSFSVPCARVSTPALTDSLFLSLPLVLG
jgi:hypothetical protein